MTTAVHGTNQVGAIKRRVSIHRAAKHLGAVDGTEVRCPHGCGSTAATTHSRYDCSAAAGGCGNDGDVIDYVRALTGASFTRAVRTLARLAEEPAKIDVASVKAAVSMPYLVHTVLALPGSGDRIRCLTPSAHSRGDQHPSCTVYDDAIHCFACGLHLDVIGVLCHVRSYKFLDAVAELRELGGQSGAVATKPATPTMAREGADFADLYDALFACCDPLPSTRGGAYLASRGIDPELAARLGVVYASNRALGRMHEVLDKFAPHTAAAAGVLDDRGLIVPRAHRLWLPSRERLGGRATRSVVWWQGRVAGNCEHPFRWRSLDGIAPALMWTEAFDTPVDVPITICEGGPDGLAAWTAGDVAVSAPGSGPPKGWWVSRFAGRRVVLAHDGNDAGHLARGRWEQALEGVAASIEHREVPDGLDLNRVLFPSAPAFRRDPA